MTVSIPYYEECQKLLEDHDTLTNRECMDLIWTVVNGYGNPTGDPIQESFLYVVCLKYASLQPLFSEVRQKEVERWMSRVGYAQMNFLDPEDNMMKNLLPHLVKTVAIVGDILHDPVLLVWADKYLLQYIDENLYTDGSCIDFHERDSLTYVTYSLNSLVLAIPALKKHFPFTDYYRYSSPCHSSIQKCMDFLKLYIEGKRVNIMFDRTTYDSDKLIHADHYQKPWNKNDAKPLFLNAAVIDPECMEYYQQFLV